MIFLGVNLRVPSIHTHYTHRHDRSRNERDNWANCPPGVDHWIRPPRPPDCDDAVQNLGLYHHAAGTRTYQRLETGPLHEDPTSSDVLVSNRGDSRCRHCADRSSGLDVLKH